MSTFTKRKLAVQFDLAAQPGNPQPTFIESGGNSLALTDLRISAEIIKAGGPSFGQANLRIYGMTGSTMAQLTTLGMHNQLIPFNPITVSAIDDSGNPTVVYKGSITRAWANLQDPPNVFFEIEAHTLAQFATDLAPPKSFEVATSVIDLMQQFAKDMGLSFRNYGIEASTQLQFGDGYYLYGSTRDQAQSVVDAAGIDWNHGDGDILAIFPRGKSMPSDTPFISSDTGMKGYPKFTQSGISVVTLFNPGIVFCGDVNVLTRTQALALTRGDIVDTQTLSLLNGANGTWHVTSLRHELDSHTPNGRWFSYVEGLSSKFFQPVVLDQGSQQ